MIAGSSTSTGTSLLTLTNNGVSTPNSSSPRHPFAFQGLPCLPLCGGHTGSQILDSVFFGLCSLCGCFLCGSVLLLLLGSNLFGFLCDDLRGKVFGCLDAVNFPATWQAVDLFFLVLLFKPGVVVHVMFQVMVTPVDEGIPRTGSFCSASDQEKVMPLVPWGVSLQMGRLECQVLAT
jgi:hypothetical protein